ncbi:hypothetical protein FLA105534_01509 [Flavobacterium bizetiae]|uniref:Uncharacterized protein n=1 Tax=Flavobacterium bizetiae TaxID=2704140 RepID=A0A6J4GDI1_9FLAO|nr:hypothetical protein FLA105534_01509 [Flavobacterium bizetiae]CAD5342881.1 hypothetical protein FLA105535_02878 [Flavobacterium bizetiae]CAD5349292.1 hypothetical protein FLA105534_03276 [Flavobacterium bizetiae]
MIPGSSFEQKLTIEGAVILFEFASNAIIVKPTTFSPAFS